uniref:Chromo domain-containing protein n=1 Tax=Bracon brevicornis TaxID=1563983 RepID=A0A6V7KEI4_9HYME
MWKTFSIQGTYKWIDIINELVADYNNTKHRTIKVKPRDVTLENEKYLLRHIYGKFEANRTKNVKFKVGDHVRISKYKTVLEKGYTPNWTTEIFKIIKIQNTNTTTYLLEDRNKERVEGAFYQEELAKVKYPDVFLVEKVLKRKGNKEFMKWLGFNSSYNSWIDADKF